MGFFFSIKGWEDPLHIRKQTDLFNNFCCVPVSAGQVLGMELHSWQPTLCSPCLPWDTSLLTLDIRWHSSWLTGTKNTTLSNVHRLDGRRVRQTHSIFFFETTCGWPSQTNSLAPDSRTMWFSLLLCDCYIKSKLWSWGMNMWWSPETDGWSPMCRERATATAGIFTLPLPHTVIWGKSWTRSDAAHGGRGQCWEALWRDNNCLNMTTYLDMYGQIHDRHKLSQESGPWSTQKCYFHTVMYLKCYNHLNKM